jgi:hypothetical protein
MKTFITTVALLAAGLFASTASAQAADLHVGIGIGIHIGGGHSHRQGHYHRPAPVFVPAPRVYCPPPVIVVPAPRPVYCPPPVVIIERPVIVERPCPEPFVTTVYEERWVETTTVVGYDRVWDSYSRCWTTVERTVTRGAYRRVPVTVTAYWYEDMGSYAYRGSDGFLHRISR